MFSRWLGRFLPVVLAALLAAMLTAAPASAHTDLEESSPADGKRVAKTPAEVTLTFSEPVNAIGTSVTVTGPDGEVQQGPPKLVDETVTQPLRSGAPGGSYTVKWRTTAQDGDAISGSFRFSDAGQPAPTTAAPRTSESAAPTPTPSTSQSAASTPAPGTGQSATATPAPAAGQSSPLSGIPGWASILIGVVAVALGIKVARDARARGSR